MTNMLLTSSYIFNQELRIWAKPGFAGINYTDGNETEQRIAGAINQASDISVLSTELRQHCTDWPALYHLSSTRANIMRPFENVLKGDVLEIGAGCGAITRYLGECGANVLALEGSPRRAAITRSRTRDLENVTVLAEKFDQFQCDRQFDAITLIGVLEYANLFTTGENPPLVMLERVRALLKPAGKLIIAIENQLGLKYFAGAPEDHLGKAMYGIEGRYQANQPQTFGRLILERLLQDAGFKKSEFLAPFPDYKLPVSILTERGIGHPGFDAAALAWQSVGRDPQLPSDPGFSLEMAWPEIFKNGMAMDMANSFLVLASTSEECTAEQSVLGYHYSTDRLPEFCKETVFKCNFEDDVLVACSVLYKKDVVAEESTQVISFHPQHEIKYTLGKSLLLEFQKIVSRENWALNDIVPFVNNYIGSIRAIANERGYSFALTSSKERLPGMFFDVVPQNIIIRPDSVPVAIDQEWSLCEDIELGQLLFRSLLMLIARTTYFSTNTNIASISRKEFILRVIEASGYPVSDRDFERFIDVEASIQQRVTGRSKEEFLQWWPDNPLLAREARNAQLDEALAEQEARNVQLAEALAEQEAQIANFTQIVATQDAYIRTLVGSKSWFITKPVRWAGRIIRGDFGAAMDPIKKALHLRNSAELSSQAPTGHKPTQACGAFVIPSPIKPTHPVAVILPVYRGIEMTKRCILAAMPGMLSVPGSRLIAINDASPDIGMQEMLEQLATQWPNVFMVLKNESNLGFVGTVNRGFAYFPQHDAVLLNSDVIVPRDWLCRLIDEAYSRADIGTVTPFSNNAMICSFPYFLQENILPFDLDVDSVDAVFRHTKLPCIEAPTGVGFCMYIRRACLDVTGHLDQEKFGRGYGEENDLCQRALKSGWLNIISPNLYAYHKGGVSFSSDKQALVDRAMRVIDELHPGYHARVQNFIAQDPLKLARVERHIQLLAVTAVPKILHISHSIGGGVGQHIEELAHYFSQQAAHILLTPHGEDGAVSISLGIDCHADKLVFQVPNEYGAMVDLLKSAGISAVHIHHTIGLKTEILDLSHDLGVAYLLTVHDYYWLNGNPTLTNENGQYPGFYSDTLRNPLYPLPQGVTPESWQAQFRRLIEGACCVIFPSSATKALFDHVYETPNAVVAPHIEAQLNVSRKPTVVTKKDTYSIGVIGAIGREKGADLLEKVAATSKNLNLPLEFKLIGYAYRSLRAVKTTGPYKTQDLPDLIQKHGLDIVFFPAQCPETYSYTLSHALDSGLPIIAPNIGAFPERLSGRVNTLLFNHLISASELLNQINAFIEALSAGVLIDAPIFEGDRSRSDFYACDYMPIVSRSLKVVDNDKIKIPQLNAFKIISGSKNNMSIWRNSLTHALWRLYMNPAMRWVNYVIPYSVRRFIKRSLTRSPIHDVIN